jgi:hypothetical protein
MLGYNHPNQMAAKLMSPGPLPLPVLRSPLLVPPTQSQDDFLQYRRHVNEMLAEAEQEKMNYTWQQQQQQLAILPQSFAQLRPPIFQQNHFAKMFSSINAISAGQSRNSTQIWPSNNGSSGVFAPLGINITTPIQDNDDVITPTAYAPPLLSRTISDARAITGIEPKKRTMSNNQIWQKSKKKLKLLRDESEKREGQRIAEEQKCEILHQPNLSAERATLPSKNLLHGERRLIIKFTDFGTKGAIPQTYGKSGHFVPDGLKAKHKLYHQEWKVSTRHSRQPILFEKQLIVCITWSVTHLTSGIHSSRTETVQEALCRMSKGRTISNEVFRSAMILQAQLLMKELQTEPDRGTRTHLEILVKTLQPRCFNQGLLVFGLQHQAVQDNIR